MVSFPHMTGLTFTNWFANETEERSRRADFSPVFQFERRMVSFRTASFQSAATQAEPVQVDACTRLSPHRTTRHAGLTRGRRTESRSDEANGCMGRRAC